VADVDLFSTFSGQAFTRDRVAHAVAGAALMLFSKTVEADADRHAAFVLNSAA
jgi:hypothetical protein